MMSDRGKALGSTIRLRRVRTGMTLGELSVLSGVSSSYLGRIERGKSLPSARILRKISKPLDFDENDLLYLAAMLLVSEQVTK